jgi:hypothetical protein
MSRLALLVAASFSLVSVAACHPASRPSAESTISSATVAPAYAALVGKWQFVYTDQRRAAVEAELTSKISDPKALADAKKEASEEADASEIEFTADNQFLSRIEGNVILRDTFSAKEGADGKSLDLSSGRGSVMSVVIQDANTIALMDPKKGELVFRRVP